MVLGSWIAGIGNQLLGSKKTETGAGLDFRVRCNLITDFPTAGAGIYYEQKTKILVTFDPSMCSFSN